jgi:hypothetical protein
MGELPGKRRRSSRSRHRASGVAPEPLTKSAKEVIRENRLRKLMTLLTLILLTAIAAAITIGIVTALHL